MASKKFKNKPCAYCDRTSATADHVIAKEFFLTRRRANLPKVPACECCNSNKSKLEHYLTTVLPFAGRHEDALESIRTALPDRLSRNYVLASEIRRSSASAVEFDILGMPMPTIAITIESQQLEAWCRYLAQGLAYHHWQHRIPSECAFQFLAPNTDGVRILDRLLRMRGRRSVSNDLGNGTFCYEGTELLARGRSSVWKFKMYGGVLIGGADANERTTVLAMLVAPSASAEVQ